MVLPNENSLVRKPNSNKIQILRRILLRKYQPNTSLQDILPEGNLQADDEIITPQDVSNIITWKQILKIPQQCPTEKKLAMILLPVLINRTL